MKATRLEVTGEPVVTDDAASGTLTVALPIRIHRYSSRREVAMPADAVSGPSGETPAPTAFQAALARGHRWLRQIERGQVSHLTALAQRERLDRSYVSRMINLALLAPDIQAAILDDTLPPGLLLADLSRPMPLLWAAQRAQLGMV